MPAEAISVFLTYFFINFDTEFDKGMLFEFLIHFWWQESHALFAKQRSAAWNHIYSSQ